MSLVPGGLTLKQMGPIVGLDARGKKKKKKEKKITLTNSKKPLQLVLPIQRCVAFN